jgi:hypothetical protein
MLPFLKQQVTNRLLARTFARFQSQPGWARHLPEDPRTFHVGSSKKAHNFQQALARLETWGGWSTSHLCIMEVVKQLRISGPCRYLEIGVNEGLSVYALVTSLRLQRILRQPHRLLEPLFEELVLADNWSATCGGTGRGSNQHISRLLQNLNVTSNHTAYLDGDSKATVPDYLHGRGDSAPFDLIYVDGDHSYAGALRDLENVLPHVGSVLFFDDMYHPSHCVADRLLEVHMAMVERLRHDFYAFLNRQWFGFAAFVRKAVFDAAA